MSDSGANQASPAITRWATFVPPGGHVLDVAAGSGRHTLLFLARGHRVTAVDRDVTALQKIAHDQLTLVQADLENAPWPNPGQTFAAVVVSNYLWRPLLATMVAAVAPGGVLMYETFGAGQERLGRPRNPDFLLQPGELLEAVRGHLEVREYWCGEEGGAMRQRICAVRAAVTREGAGVPQAGEELMSMAATRASMFRLRPSDLTSAGWLLAALSMAFGVLASVPIALWALEAVDRDVLRGWTVPIVLLLALPGISLALLTFGYGGRLLQRAGIQPTTIEVRQPNSWIGGN